MVSAVVAQKAQTKMDPPVSMPSSVMIGDRVSAAAEEADRLIDDYFDNYQSQAYTRVNPETGRVEPITPTLPDMPDDSEGAEDTSVLGERAIIPYVSSGACDVAVETVSPGRDRKRRRVTSSMGDPSEKKTAVPERRVLTRSKML